MLLDKKNLKEALRLLSEQGEVYIPGEVSGVSRFVLWQSGAEELPEDYVNTQLPPKDILFPNTEKMYAYKTGDGEITGAEQSKKQVIFGIRPCDMRAIECMDKVFLEKSYTDSFYSDKREKSVLIAIGCTVPCKTCFCDSMGLDLSSAPAADMLIFDKGEAYEVSPQTDKGQAVADLWSGLLTKAKTAKTAKAKCELKAKMGDKLPEKLAAMFEHPIWDEAGRACIGCGTCTYVCPTCYCFDIGLDNRGSEGVAFRCWDSCMFSDYTAMAGGHNPRPTKKERVRNRYMHKLSYFNERYGMTLCVGCGRCVDKCPSNMDITEFIDIAAEVAL